ncbi:MAG: hypothetical protein LUF85_04135 [Bacteroides sp.]|nr:hypothetical protein [Bacteroides sp.]
MRPIASSPSCIFSWVALYDFTMLLCISLTARSNSTFSLISATSSRRAWVLPTMRSSPIVAC